MNPTRRQTLTLLAFLPLLAVLGGSTYGYADECPPGTVHDASICSDNATFGSSEKSCVDAKFNCLINKLLNMGLSELKCQARKPPGQTTRGGEGLQRDCTFVDGVFRVACWEDTHCCYKPAPAPARTPAPPAPRP